jgi:hypothetical protein
LKRFSVFVLFVEVSVYRYSGKIVRKSRMNSGRCYRNLSFGVRRGTVRIGKVGTRNRTSLVFFTTAQMSKKY